MLSNLKAILRPLKHKYPSVFSCYKPSRAKYWAHNDKRLDLVSAQLAYMLHFIGNRVSNRTCLEIGSGWVLSHALAFHLLGAARVYATDLIRLARPEVLKIAIGDSSQSLIRDILSPYEDHEVLRERLNRIFSIKNWSFDTLSELGIEYRAPFNILTDNHDPVDFAFSISVLEHINKSDASSFVDKLCEHSREQFHFIHLEDHYSSEKPFGFLSVKDYPEALQLERGNRIRSDQWISMFEKNKSVKVIHRWIRKKPIPDYIDGSILYSDQRDLKTSHLGLYVY
jgi:hypothetical protein